MPLCSVPVHALRSSLMRCARGLVMSVNDGSVGELLETILAFTCVGIGGKEV